MIGLGLIREPNETWRDAVDRIASRHGRSVQCLRIFDRLKAKGEDESIAALEALSEHDCLSTLDARKLVKGNASR